jgi:hypothetical protein
MIRIVESGVTFGEYFEENVYQIEKSKYVNNLSGVKSCEFVLYKAKENILFFIEAKSSIPNPNNSKDKYNLFFDEVVEKLENSMVISTLGINGKLPGVHEELTELMKNINWSLVSFKLVLVIPKVPTEILPQMSEKLRSMFVRQRKTWAISSLNILVLNEELARTNNLII